MKYEFKCNCKGYVPITKVIETTVKNYYVPTCPNCEKKMDRIYSPVSIHAGCLDPANLPKGS